MTALTRLLGSTPFRLTVAYMGAFVAAAALIVLYVAWQANELLASKAVEALRAEVASLRGQFEAGGTPRLVAAINERVSEPGSERTAVAWGRPGAMSGSRRLANSSTSPGTR